MADYTWGGYFSIYGSPQLSLDWRKAIVAYNTEVRYVNSCTPGPIVNIFQAYLSADKAVIDKHNGDDPQTDLNLAMQRFTKCASDFFAKPQGAQCQTMTETLAKLKVEWMSENAR